MKNKTRSTDRKRPYVSQENLPSFSLDQALRIVKTIADNYALKPTRPVLVAQALGIKPTSSQFKQLCSASIAFGLSVGGSMASEIQVTDLGKRIVTSSSEQDAQAARREVVLKPKIIRKFLEKYNGNKFPRREEIGCNVLVEMGVPMEAAKKARLMIIQCAESVGFLRDIKDDKYVDIQSVSLIGEGTDNGNAVDSEETTSETSSVTKGLTPSSASSHVMSSEDQRKRRVFVTHGKNRSFLDTLKRLLAFGELEPVVSVERQSASQPVTEKVMNEMRSCSASIIHVDVEEKLVDEGGKERAVINPNVLIEIGASMALFGRRLILLVREGLQLPSNLQGLFEVRYAEDELNANTALKLIEAIKDMKNQAMPKIESLVR